MATNQMRREAAKRKLERQQERRAQQAKRRQRVALITSVAVVVVVVAAFVLLTTLGRGGGSTDQAAAPSDAATPSAAADPAAAPPGTCAFTATPDEPAAKPAPVPTATNAPTSGTVPVALQTDAGPISLTLDRAQAPCTVESYLNLVNAGYYNGTPCHRLTTSEGLKVLQCGDPTGTGSGGPGYTINDEKPSGLKPDPTGQAVIYPRGTVAMAKTSAPNSGGSQFFLVYADSTLPPDYTVFGTIGADGLATLDKVALGGSDDSNGQGDGKPKIPVTIQTATAS